MTAGSWLNSDNLFLKFGTAKATPEIAGEFQSPGENRIVEVIMDITSTNANQYWSTASSPVGFGVTNAANSPLIISDTELFPASIITGSKLYIEQVEVITLVGMTVLSGATAINVGVISANDRATIPSGGSTALVNGLINAGFTTTGQKAILSASTAYGTYNGTTYAGGYIGVPTTATTYPLLLTLTTVGGAGTYSAGLLKVRIKYFIYGNIVQ